MAKQKRRGRGGEGAQAATSAGHVQLSWNQFQSIHKRQGLSNSVLSDMWKAYKAGTYTVPGALMPTTTAGGQLDNCGVITTLERQLPSPAGDVSTLEAGGSSVGCCEEESGMQQLLPNAQETRQKRSQRQRQKPRSQVSCSVVTDANSLQAAVEDSIGTEMSAADRMGLGQSVDGCCNAPYSAVARGDEARRSLEKPCTLPSAVATFSATAELDITPALDAGGAAVASSTVATVATPFTVAHVLANAGVPLQTAAPAAQAGAVVATVLPSVPERPSRNSTLQRMVDAVRGVLWGPSVATVRSSVALIAENCGTDIVARCVPEATVGCTDAVGSDSGAGHVGVSGGGDCPATPQQVDEGESVDCGNPVGGVHGVTNCNVGGGDSGVNAAVGEQCCGCVSKEWKLSEAVTDKEAETEVAAEEWASPAVSCDISPQRLSVDGVVAVDGTIGLAISITADGSEGSVAVTPYKDVDTYHDSCDDVYGTEKQDGGFSQQGVGSGGGSRIPCEVSPVGTPGGDELGGAAAATAMLGSLIAHAATPTSPEFVSPVTSPNSFGQCSCEAAAAGDMAGGGDICRPTLNIDTAAAATATVAARDSCAAAATPAGAAAGAADHRGGALSPGVYVSMAAKENQSQSTLNGLLPPGGSSPLEGTSSRGRRRSSRLQQQELQRQQQRRVLRPLQQPSCPLRPTVGGATSNSKCGESFCSDGTIVIDLCSSDDDDGAVLKENSCGGGHKNAKGPPGRKNGSGNDNRTGGQVVDLMIDISEDKPSTLAAVGPRDSGLGVVAMPVVHRYLDAAAVAAASVQHRRNDAEAAGGSGKHSDSGAAGSSISGVNSRTCVSADASEDCEHAAAAAVAYIAGATSTAVAMNTQQPATLDAIPERGQTTTAAASAASPTAEKPDLEHKVNAGNRMAESPTEIPLRPAPSSTLTQLHLPGNAGARVEAEAEVSAAPNPKSWCSAGAAPVPAPILVDANLLAAAIGVMAPDSRDANQQRLRRSKRRRSKGTGGGLTGPGSLNNACVHPKESAAGTVTTSTAAGARSPPSVSGSQTGSKLGGGGGDGEGGLLSAAETSSIQVPAIMTIMEEVIEADVSGRPDVGSLRTPQGHTAAVEQPSQQQERPRRQGRRQPQQPVAEPTPSNSNNNSSLNAARFTSPASVTTTVLSQHYSGANKRGGPRQTTLDKFLTTSQQQQPQPQPSSSSSSRGAGWERGAGEEVSCPRRHRRRGLQLPASPVTTQSSPTSSAPKLLSPPPPEMVDLLDDDDEVELVFSSLPATPEVNHAIPPNLCRPADEADAVPQQPPLHALLPQRQQLQVVVQSQQPPRQGHLQRTRTESTATSSLPRMSAVTEAVDTRLMRERDLKDDDPLFAGFSRWALVLPDKMVLAAARPPPRPGIYEWGARAPGDTRIVAFYLGKAGGGRSRETLRSRFNKYAAATRVLLGPKEALAEADKAVRQPTRREMLAAAKKASKAAAAGIRDVNVTGAGAAAAVMTEGRLMAPKAELWRRLQSRGFELFYRYRVCEGAADAAVAERALHSEINYAGCLVNNGSYRELLLGPPAPGAGPGNTKAASRLLDHTYCSTNQSNSYSYILDDYPVLRPDLERTVSMYQSATGAAAGTRGQQRRRAEEAKEREKFLERDSVAMTAAKGEGGTAVAEAPRAEEVEPVYAATIRYDGATAATAVRRRQGRTVAAALT